MKQFLLFLVLAVSAISASAQTTYVLSPVAHQQFFNASGVPLSMGLLCTYAAGTTTPLPTYQDALGTVNTNPVILDGGGFANVWLPAGVPYKFVAFASGTCQSGVQQWSVDNIIGGGTGSGGGGSGGGSVGPGTPTFYPLFVTTGTIGNSPDFNSNSTANFPDIQGIFTPQLVASGSGTYTGNAEDLTTPNCADGTGTVVYYLAKILAGCATRAGTGDTVKKLYAIGPIVTANGLSQCGGVTTSFACRILTGYAQLTADASGTIPADDYVGESTTVAGAIADLGTAPTSGCFGKAIASIAANGVGTVDVGNCPTAASGSTINFADGETPGGTKNGSNVTFTLANAPSPSTSLHLYKNGQRLTLTGDYSLSTLTITMVVAPLSGDVIYADYRH